MVFLSEEEKSPLLRIPCNGGEQHFATLLGELARTDITSVYRLGEFPSSSVHSPTDPPREQPWAMPRELLLGALPRRRQPPGPLLSLAYGAGDTLKDCSLQEASLLQL